MTSEEKELQRQFDYLSWISPVRGDVFRHYKGGLYTVVACCLTEKDKVATVVYQDLASGRVWCRPLDEFADYVVNIDGISVPRFERQPHRLRVSP